MNDKVSNDIWLKALKDQKTKLFHWLLAKIKNEVFLAMGYFFGVLPF